MSTGAFPTNPGSGGSSFSADLVGAERVPISKLDVGAPGTTSLVGPGVGMPVTIVQPANNAWAQALSLTNGSTGTLASIPASIAGYQIKGVVAHGTGDGYFFIQVSSVTVLSGRTRATMPMLMISLPNGIAVATGSSVALKVTNESGSTSDYEATLLGS